MRRIRLMGLFAATGLFSACGSPPSLDFPNRFFGAEGQEFTLDDITAITDDPDLTTDQKREELRGLGIEDEQLIDALLTL